MTGNSRADIIVKNLIINHLTIKRTVEKLDRNLVESTIRLTIKVNRLHRQRIEEQVGKFGFHRTAHMMLMHLAREEHSSSQRALAERFSITPAAVTGLLKRLENDGYIIRRAGKDSRFNEISITELGKRIVDRSREEFGRTDEMMLRGFSDEELVALSGMLSRMVENMEGSKEISK